MIFHTLLLSCDDCGTLHVTDVRMNWVTKFNYAYVIEQIIAVVRHATRLASLHVAARP